MSTQHLPPDDDPQEVACTVPADHDADEGTLAILAREPDDDGEA